MSIDWKPVRGLARRSYHALRAVVQQGLELLARGARRAGRSPLLRRGLARSGRLAGTLAVGGLLGLVAFGAVHLCTKRVPPGQVGVRQVDWGGNGLVEQDFGVGMHFSLPGRETWHLLRSGVHVLNYAWESEGGSEEILAVATRDGEAVSVAASVLYQIREGEGWRLVAEGLKNDYPRRASAIAQRVLLEELGQLGTEEFFRFEARENARLRALMRLSTDLAEVHLDALDVRIGTVFFDSTFEKKMQEKQLAGQQVLTAASIEARRTQEQANQRALHELAEQQRAVEEEVRASFLERRLALEQELRETQQNGEDAAARMRFEADAEAAGLRAEGDLALAQVEATREARWNSVLGSEGGQIYLAREAAKRLKFDRITLDANDPRTPSPLDLGSMVRMLVGE